MKIAVAGTGYVGLSVATLLSQHHDVTAVDIIPEKVALINRRVSPVKDSYIEKYFREKPLKLKATLDAAAAYRDSDFVIIAAPTNYDDEKNFFDTSAVETVISLVLEMPRMPSLSSNDGVAVGYTEQYRVRANSIRRRFLFSPEFLRESKALYDNLYPSRIIIGADMQEEGNASAARRISGLLAAKAPLH